MVAGAVFPPLVVFEEGERFWLAEGFHRLEAYTAAGFAEVPCDVRQGGLRDAILHSAGANPDHGVRRTSADKRRAVLTLLQDEEWGQWSDREIARRCAVSQPLVGRIRAEHLKIVSDSARLVERGGTTYSMKPRQRSAGPEPEPSAPPEAEAQSELQEGTPVAGEAPAEKPSEHILAGGLHAEEVRV